MSTKKFLVLLGVLVLSGMLLAACAGEPGPQGEAGPAGPAGPAADPLMAADLSCTECHNSSGTISTKRAGWEATGHGGGEAYIEEYGRNSCAFCHSGNAFSAAVAAGQNFSQLETGAPEPARQDCFTCHQIHETYTGEDWALETSDPVVMVTSGVTFDGGAGNLCANCHQARRYLAGFVDSTDATKYTTGRRFNTHYSVQADVLIGAGDFGVEGKPGAHYSMVENTCVACHMGDADNHTFEPQLATCQACHADAENFDINGYLTEFEEKYAELEAALVFAGMLRMNADGTTSNIEGTYEAGPAQALFFYNLVHEDGSEGIHNPNYFKALLENAIAAVQPSEEVVAACTDLAADDVCTVGEVEGVCVAVLDVVACQLP